MTSTPTDVPPPGQVPEQQRSQDVLLRSGGMAQLRRVTTDDEMSLRALNARVSSRTRMLRYFSPSEQPGDWYVDHVLRSARTDDALVALVGGHVVALGSFFRLQSDPTVGDLALLVDDEHQSEGLGALLLEHLAHLARRQGITSLSADVLVENHAMLQLLKESGFATRSHTSLGVHELRIDLAVRPQLWEALQRRDAEAERASLRAVFEPTSVVVVGSTRDDSVPAQVHQALRTGGFSGELRHLRRQDALTGPVDLVVVAVAAEHVLTVAKSAAAAGAKGLVVLSAGFAETGPAGAARQEDLLRLCRSTGLRLVGPNCLGIVNTDPLVKLNATFCDAHPQPGGVALVSQSGAVGIAALRHAERRGAGLSLFISTGNKADVSGNDLLAYLSGDPRTRVIALYLESFGNARTFVRLAAVVGRTTPIVVLKAGRTQAGARAGLSHTAAVATPDVAIDALLREAGVIRADDLPGMFDLLCLLESAPLPRGRRIAVVGNAGGPGVLAIDSCEAAGLDVAELSPATRELLRGLLPAAASTTNPVDLLSTVSAEVFEQAVTAVLRDPGVDAVITVYTPLRRGCEDTFAAALLRAHAAEPDTTLVATFPGVTDAPWQLQERPLQVPFFEFPETAAFALGKVTDYAVWRSTPAAPRVEQDLPAAQATARSAMADAAEGPGWTGWLSPHAATAVLEAYGIPMAQVKSADTADEAVASAARVGYPVVLKAVGPAILHKSDVGGVALDLQDEEQVRQAFRDMHERLGTAMTSAVVQHMHDGSDALELLLGLTVDETVGPLVLVAAGGVLTDLLDDRVVRMPPDSMASALAQLSALRCAPRFAGYRSAPPLPLEAVAGVLLCLANLARDLPEVCELDINPLIVTPTGVLGLDTRVRVCPVSASALPESSLVRPRH